MRHLVPFLLALLAMLGGCATAPPRITVPPPALFADSAFKPPSETIGADGLFTLSPAMRDYLHSPAFAAQLRGKSRERGLVDALYSKSDLMLEYEASKTRTAAETYAARAGNCLSLVIMTAAFARELGLTVRFQNVIADGTWGREGGLFLVASHVNITLAQRRANSFQYDTANGRELVVDFLMPSAAESFHTRELDEGDIVALYLNNRAAETLVQGRVDDAYWWARAAVHANPRSEVAYNTLGVIYQRRGEPALAERAFRAALERQPDSLPVLQNLGPLLARLGRLDEAQALAQRAAIIEPTPPYHYFNQGMAALQRGDNRIARDLFKREVARAPYNDEFHFWLAVAHLRLGEAEQARTQLVLARDNSTRRDMREAYSAKLAHLRQSGEGRTRRTYIQ